MKILFSLLILISVYFEVYSQGCVAIRSTGGMSNLTAHPDSIGTDGGWIFTANNRYFKSFRHFKGTEEQKERLEIGNEVINYQYALDLVFTKIINARWSVLLDIPILANGRSSLYEHGREERHFTHSFGLGDVRIAAYRWMMDPDKKMNGNVQVGLGIKLPTGDYNYKDFWQNVGPDGGRDLRTVDQSIQLGDGGTGITLEVNAFQSINHNFGLYGNFFYLSNPREHNGVRTYREMVSDRLANESIMSVPDQYMVRGGFNYIFKSLTASIGGRVEGVPVYDLIGGSGEFRRPGYVWSLEPGITFNYKNIQLFATAPIALHRNRTQSVTDKERTVSTGEFVQGDAAFADYSVNFGISIRLNKKTEMVHVDSPELFNHTKD